MPQSADEIRFNQSVANGLLPAFKQETGIDLELVPTTDDFPDLICRRTADGGKMGFELVEVILAFINQEHRGLQSFQDAAGDAVSAIRPLMKGKVVSLQLSHNVSDVRPHFIGRDEGTLVKELIELLRMKHQELIKQWGGLLLPLTANGTNPRISNLLKHFEAVLINDIPEAERERYGDDPKFDFLSRNHFSTMEIDKAVHTAIMSKHESKKGSAYKTENLVLHTHPADHKPSSQFTWMYRDGIVASGRFHAAKVRNQFSQVWYFDSYTNEGSGLFKLL